MIMNLIKGRVCVHPMKLGAVAFTPGKLVPGEKPDKIDSKTSGES